MYTQSYTADMCAHGYTAASSVALLWKSVMNWILARLMMTDLPSERRLTMWQPIGLFLASDKTPCFQGGLQEEVYRIRMCKGIKSSRRQNELFPEQQVIKVKDLL